MYSLCSGDERNKISGIGDHEDLEALAYSYFDKL